MRSKNKYTNAPHARLRDVWHLLSKEMFQCLMQMCAFKKHVTLVVCIVMLKVAKYAIYSSAKEVMFSVELVDSLFVCLLTTLCKKF